MILLFFLYSGNICNMTLLLFVESIIMYSPFCTSCKDNNLLSFSCNKIECSSIRITNASRKRFQESLEGRDVI